MTDRYELASAIFGTKRAEADPSTLSTAIITGTAVEDSDSGMVRIIPDGNVIAPEGEDNSIVLPTSPNVKSGDNVIIISTGGTATTPIVAGASGSGDRLLAGIDGIETLIRETADGVLVAKVGQTVGALVNADGSFDVVALTWDGSEPTMGATIGRFEGKNVYLGVEPTGPADGNLATTVSMNGGLFTIQSSLTEPATSGGTDYTAALTVMRALSDLLDNWQMTVADKAFLTMSETAYGYQSAMRVDGATRPMVAGVEAVSNSKTTNNGWLNLYGDRILLNNGTARIGEVPGADLPITADYSGGGFTVENPVFHATADVVVLPIQFSSTSAMSWTAELAAHIPSGYAPSEEVRCLVFTTADWSSYQVGYANIGTDGTIKLTCKSCVAIFGQATWIRPVEETVSYRITQQPQDATIAALGDMVTFTLATNDANARYQWQVLVDEVTWQNTNLTGNKTATLSFSGTASRIARMYRCYVTFSDGTYAYSVAVSASVES